MDFDPTTAMPDAVKQLVDAITPVESGGNPNAVSSQGARGSMQITPATFQHYAQPDEDYDDDEDRRSAAVRKILDDYQYYGGDIAKTAAAYIGGRGAVRPDGTIRSDIADANGTTPAAYANMVLAQMQANGTFNPKTASATPDTGTPTPANPGVFDPSTAQPVASKNVFDPSTAQAAPPNDWKASVSPVLSAAGKGVMTPFANANKALMLAASGPFVIYDKLHNALTGGAPNNTPATDWAMRNFVQPATETQEFYQPTEEESSTVAGRFAHAGGQAVGSLPLIIASGPLAGEAAPITAATTVPEMIGTAVAGGAKVMLPTASVNALNTGADIAARGGTPSQALGAAAASGASTLLTGALPMSAGGPVLTRLATGIPYGIASGELNRRIENLPLNGSPDLQTPFTWESALTQGITGSLMAAAMGSSGERMPTRTDLGYRPEDLAARDLNLVPPGHETPITPANGNVDTANAVDAITKANNVDEAIAAYQASQPKIAPPKEATGIDLEAAQRALIAAEALPSMPRELDPVQQARALFQTPQWQEHRDMQPTDIRNSMLDTEKILQPNNAHPDDQFAIAQKVLDYANSTPAEPPRVNFEVAPDPNDAPLAAAWNSLQPAARQDISNRIAQQIVPKVLDTLGTQGDLTHQVGSYLDDTNPSFALKLRDPSKVGDVANMLGHVLSQDSMMAIAEKPFPGAEKVDAIAVDLKGEDPKAIYDKLHAITVDGEQPIQGQTTVDGKMWVLNYSKVPTDQLADLVDKTLDSSHIVEKNEVYASFPSKENYGYASDRQPGETAPAQSPLQERADSLRNEASGAIRDALAEHNGAERGNAAVAGREGGTEQPERNPELNAAGALSPVVAHALDEVTAAKTAREPVTEPQGEKVYEYPGMYGKGMNEWNARTEAARRNRTQPELVHTAEPVEGLEYPYQVVGRTRSEPEPDVLHDITSVDPETQETIRSQAFARAFRKESGQEVDPITRESVGATITRELKRLQAGKITQDEFSQRMDALNKRMMTRYEQRHAEMPAPRERGADFIREKLLQAARRGDISQDAARMGEWFVQQNPDLMDDLGISVRSTKQRGVSGQYEPLTRIATIFKDSDKSSTAVHEMLHHMERLMPEPEQLAIRTEYQRNLMHDLQNGTPEMREFLGNIVKGDPESLKAARDMLIKGKLPIDAYKYTNPSEYWAVNMTRVLENRYRAQDSGIWARSKQWLGEAVEHIKGALGLRSDAPMLRELNRMLSKGDGTFVNRSMLQDDYETAHNIQPDEEKESIYSHVDPRNIVHGYSPYVGVEMRKLPSGSFKDAVQTAFAPASRSVAKQAAGIIRGNLGEQAYGREQALTKLRGFAKMFDKFAPEDNFKFIDDIENGRVIDNPRLNAAATALRGMLDSYRDRVRSLGTGALENFNVNYFPHIYKDPAAAESFFRGILSKRSLEGGKGFLKQRKYDSLADAIRPVDQGGGGLTPITDNPVEMTLLKLREMDRYIYGQKIFRELKDSGLAKFYRPGQAPDGWVKINDKIGNVVSPSDGGMVHRGDYYAPQEAATVINNHLSPGLAGNGFYDAFRGIGNAMNTAQLALSLYHVGFTTLDAVVSKNALAAMQFRRGDIAQGAKNLFMGTLGMPIAPFANAYHGDRLLKAYRGDISDPALAPMVEALQAAGARQRDELYRNTTVNAFKQAARAGRYGEAAWKAIPTVFDYLNKPVFEYLVPRQKFGVFFDMAQDAIKANPNMDMATKREVFGKLWDSVDNRMGELVYDNVFWNRALKDALMATTRSVGWNLGTYRELGGGIMDAKSLFVGKNLSPRTAYVLALPFTTAMVGAAIQYLYTGQGPDELKDCFFPKDGGVELDGQTPTRKSLPSYVKDVGEYYHDIEGFVKYGNNPFNTLKNKMSPTIATIGQMLTNRDYYDNAIRSPGDPAVLQMEKVGTYLLKQILPFSIRNYQKQPEGGAAGGGIPGYVTSASFYGLAPAPSYITKSAADLESQEVAKDAPALMGMFRQEIKDNGVQPDTVQRMIDAGLTLEQRKLVLRNSTGQYHQHRLRQFNPQGQ